MSTLIQVAEDPTACLCFISMFQLVAIVPEAMPLQKAILCVISINTYRLPAQSRSGLAAPPSVNATAVQSHTADSEYERNLHFFVERGMRDGDGCHYIIVVQEVCLRM